MVKSGRPIYPLANKKEKPSGSKEKWEWLDTWKVMFNTALDISIYNLAEEAEQQKAILRLIIPQKCKLSPELTDFLKEHKYVKVIRRD